MANRSYPDFGNIQPKTMWTTTYRKLGNQRNMRQPIDLIAFGRRVRERRETLILSQTTLGEQSGYSQSNIAWIESGKPKDPRIQAQDLAMPLRTTAEWLLFGTGTKELAAPPMTPEELANNYQRLSLDEREAISAAVFKYMTELAKKRKRRK